MIARFAIWAALLGPSLAMAQDVSVETSQGRTQFIGTAPLACLLSTPVGNQISGATLTTTGASAQLTFSSDTLIDPQTAVARPFTMSLAVPVLCNAAHSVIIRSLRGGMAPQSGTTQVNGFSSRIDLDVSASWAGTNVQGSTNGNPLSLSINVLDAASGNVEVTLRGVGGTNPLVAGRYSDGIVIDLAALQ
jgi:hypothetical protein